jgi:peptide/nickel transport system substrate-binding protein
MPEQVLRRPGQLLGILAAVGMLLAVACGVVAQAPTPTQPSVIETPTPTAIDTVPVAVRAQSLLWVTGRGPDEPVGLLHRLGGMTIFTDSVADTLIEWTPDGLQGGLLATHWEQVAPDRWRYTLREGVEFHNGEPFNASTAAWSLKEQTGPDSTARVVRYAPDLRGEAVDEYTPIGSAGDVGLRHRHSYELTVTHEHFGSCCVLWARVPDGVGR